MRRELETQRLLLRPFTEADVDNLFDLDADPEVMRFINGGVATPRELIRTRILPWFMRRHGSSEAPGFWAALERASGAFIGWFGLHPEADRAPDELALGYRLNRNVWRRGYGTEGATALVDKAFRELGARRVFATTYSENLASRGVMEKCGLRLVRTYRMTADEVAGSMTHLPGDAIFPGEDVEYALERADWERAAGCPPP